MVTKFIYVTSQILYFLKIIKNSMAVDLVIKRLSQEVFQKNITHIIVISHEDM